MQFWDHACRRRVQLALHFKDGSKWRKAFKWCSWALSILAAQIKKNSPPLKLFSWSRLRRLRWRHAISSSSTAAPWSALSKRLLLSSPQRRRVAAQSGLGATLDCKSLRNTLPCWKSFNIQTTTRWGWIPDFINYVWYIFLRFS